MSHLISIRCLALDMQREGRKNYQEIVYNCVLFLTVPITAKQELKDN